METLPPPQLPPVPPVEIPTTVKWQDDMAGGNLPPTSVNSLPNTLNGPAQTTPNTVPSLNQWEVPDPATRQDTTSPTVEQKSSPWAPPDASWLKYKSYGGTKRNGSPDLFSDHMLNRTEKMGRLNTFSIMSAMLIEKWASDAARGTVRGAKAVGRGLSRFGKGAMKPAQDLHVENLRGKASLKQLEASLHSKGLDKKGMPVDKDMSLKMARKKYRATQLQNRATYLENKHQAKRQPRSKIAA